MPPYSYRPALGGRREHGGHTPSWQGRAVRGGSPRGGVSLGLRPLEPPRARGARYALGTPAGRAGTAKELRPGTSERVGEQATCHEA